MARTSGFKIYPALPPSKHGALATSRTTLAKLITNVYAGDITAFTQDLGLSRTGIYRWLRNEPPGVPTISALFITLGLTREECVTLYVSNEWPLIPYCGSIVSTQDSYDVAAYKRVEDKLRKYRDELHPGQIKSLNKLLGYVPSEDTPVNPIKEDNNNNYMLDFDAKERQESVTIKDKLALTVKGAIAQALQNKTNNLSESILEHVDDRILSAEGRMMQQLEVLNTKVAAQEDIIMRLVSWLTSSENKDPLALLDILTGGEQ